MNWDFAKMLQAGANITIGSDWGAGSFPGLLPSVAGILDAVACGEGRIAGAQKLCRLLTLSGAEAVGRGNDFGSARVDRADTAAGECGPWIRVRSARRPPLARR